MLQIVHLTKRFSAVLPVSFIVVKGSNRNPLTSLGGHNSFRSADKLKKNMLTNHYVGSFEIIVISFPILRKLYLAALLVHLAVCHLISDEKVIPEILPGLQSASQSYQHVLQKVEKMRGKRLDQMFTSVV